MKTEEFASRLIELFPQIIKAFVCHENNELASGKITLPQFWALDYISQNGKSTMNCLAKNLRISPAATTGLIDRLISQKLVDRKDDEQDRRIVWICLTSKGKEIICNIKRQKIKAIIKVFGGISSNDRKQYLAILEKIVSINSTTRSKKQA
jgi:DNA-binding MarR family transcriptional regulator